MESLVTLFQYATYEGRLTAPQGQVCVSRLHVPLRLMYQVDGELDDRVIEATVTGLPRRWFELNCAGSE